MEAICSEPLCSVQGECDRKKLPTEFARFPSDIFYCGNEVPEVRCVPCSHSMMQPFTVEKLQVWFAKMRTSKCAEVHGFNYCNLEMFKEGNQVSWQTLIHLYNHMPVTGQFEIIWRKGKGKRERERNIQILIMIRYRRGLSLPSNEPDCYTYGIVSLDFLDGPSSIWICLRIHKSRPRKQNTLRWFYSNLQLCSTQLQTVLVLWRFHPAKQTSKPPIIDRCFKLLNIKSAAIKTLWTDNLTPWTTHTTESSHNLVHQWRKAATTAARNIGRSSFGRRQKSQRANLPWTLARR